MLPMSGRLLSCQEAIKHTLSEDVQASVEMVIYCWQLNLLDCKDTEEGNFIAMVMLPAGSPGVRKEG